MSRTDLLSSRAGSPAFQRRVGLIRLPTVALAPLIQIYTRIMSCPPRKHRVSASAPSLLSAPAYKADKDVI